MSAASYYASLLGNRTRIEAFRKGIEEAVRPGDRVLDLGTGLGTYAFFAARAGAGEVWAVDASPVVHLAETLAVANDLADGVVRFVRGSVPGVDLPRDIDVLIYEDFPTALFDRATWELLAGLAERLAPGGRMVPAAARLSLAPVESERIRRSVFPLADDGERAYGLDWTPVREVAANAPRRVELAPEELRGRAATGPRLGLLPPPPAADLKVGGEWTADRPGTVHALALWFDLEVHAGEWLSNEPWPSPEPWGQWLLPLDPPLRVREGETLTAGAGFDPLPGGAPGWLGWRASTGDERRSGHAFGGLLAAPEDLQPPPDVSE